LKIGIPRALLYYWYGNLWEDFWRDCGLDVKVSAQTDHAVVSVGAGLALDELCLPVKIFLGHLARLAPEVDLLMIPHLIKVERDAYICPKFMGLPDLVARTLPQYRSKLVVVRVGPNRVDQLKCLGRAAAQLGLKAKSRPHGDSEVYRSYQPALRAFAALNGKNRRQSGFTIGLLGHPYCLYDACFNLNTIEKLAAASVNVLTPEMTPASFWGKGSGKLAKNLFWTVGRFQFDALEWMLTEKRGDGFIQVMPFACGPEAIVGDLLERRIKQAGKPGMKLYFEEHSGEAGVDTRIEAFLDLMRYRSRVC